jgi:GNAT superfamily N-acetyltransferase
MGKRIMSPPSVKLATSGDRDSVINAIILGFSSDPVARWVWPDAATYLDAMPRFTAAFGGRGFDHQSVYATDCGHAAAMWLPPEIEPDSDAIGSIIETSVAEERMEEVGAFFAQMGEFHPHEKCWYLPIIAADPSQTGKGLGAALMKHALSVCDDQSLPAYLESSNPRNISLYERHGFEVIGKIQTETSPVMTPMYRAARG